MNRRGFMQAILAAGVAPYVVTTAGVLMPVRRPVSIAVDWGAGPDITTLAWMRQVNDIMRAHMMANPPIILHPDGRIEPLIMPPFEFKLKDAR